MIFVNYFDEIFALVGIPKTFWDHIRRDLRYDDTAEKIEGFLLFVLPGLVPASVSIFYHISLGKQFYSLLIASSTLFVGFSMNAVLLLLRYSDKDGSSDSLIDQTRNMISYLLYIGVILAGVAIFGYLAASLSDQLPSEIGIAASAIALFLISHFLIVVLLLPARIFTIIEDST